MNHLAVRLAFESGVLSSDVCACARMLTNYTIVKLLRFDFFTVGIMIRRIFIEYLA